jgi:hypothetical protein
MDRTEENFAQKDKLTLWASAGRFVNVWKRDADAVKKLIKKSLNMVIPFYKLCLTCSLGHRITSFSITSKARTNCGCSTKEQKIIQTTV